MELHYRLKTVVICDMQLNRFPHDIQNCTIKFESCELFQFVFAIVSGYNVILGCRELSNIGDSS